MGKSASKAFSDGNHPTIIRGDGKEITINHVTIRENLQELVEVGSGHAKRLAKSDRNHHMEVVETTDKKGRRKWDFHVVTLMEAYRRKKAGEPIVKRDFGPNVKFLFSIAHGDIIELNDPDKGHSLFRVTSVPASKQIVFMAINDARPGTSVPKKGRTAMPAGLLNAHCRKVVVTPLGEVRYAND